MRLRLLVGDRRCAPPGGEWATGISYLALSYLGRLYMVFRRAGTGPPEVSQVSQILDNSSS